LSIYDNRTTNRQDAKNAKGETKKNLGGLGDLAVQSRATNRQDAENAKGEEKKNLGDLGVLAVQWRKK